MNPNRALDSWWYSSDGGENGPYTSAALLRLAADGRLKPESPVRRNDWSSSVPASSIKALRRILQPDDELVDAVLVGSASATALSDGEHAAVDAIVVAEIDSEHGFDVQPITAEIVEAPHSGPTSAVALTAMLEDPMREISSKFARFLWIMFYALLVMGAFGIIFWLSSARGTVALLYYGLLNFLGTLFLAYWGNLIWWRAFAPRRPTDVFYLRSFQKDEDSWPIRVAIQDALGDQIRLSGIRDPRRRVMSVQGGFSPWLTAMRHCTPKFMDLEAENDWQARLWNSLQSGSMAIVDLSVVTSFVLVESRLVVSAIGIDRTLFVGTRPQTEIELREIIAQQLGKQAAAKAHVLLWPSDASPALQKSQMRDFGAKFKSLFDRVIQLPPIAKCPVPPEFASSQRQDSLVPMSRRMIKWMIGFQLILVAFQLALTLLSRAVTRNESAQQWILFIGYLPILTANLGLFFYNFAIYVRDVGIPRRRIKAGILMSATMLSALPVLLQFRWDGGVQTDQRAALSSSEVAEDANLLSLEDLQPSSTR